MRCSGDERTGADALGPAVRERTADLLLEREEQTRTRDEDEGPERAERAVLERAQPGVRDHHVGVGGDCGHTESRPDREGAFGDGLPGLADEMVGAVPHGRPEILGGGRRYHAVRAGGDRA